MHFIGPIPLEVQIDHPKIIYYGSIVEEHRIQEIIKSCDVLICPSYSEGIHTVIMEAMASGLAIIGTDVGAVTRQVNESNGWLLPLADVVLLKEAIINSIEIKEDVLLSKQISSIKESFLWSKVIKRKMDLIKGALAI